MLRVSVARANAEHAKDAKVLKGRTMNERMDFQEAGSCTQS